MLSNNVEHNEKSTIFVTTVNGFQAVWEDVLAEIALNTRPVIFLGSLQAVIKNHLLFPVLCRMSYTFSYRIMINECTEVVWIAHFIGYSETV